MPGIYVAMQNDDLEDSAKLIEEAREPSDHAGMEVFRNAIMRRTCVSTVYNRSEVKLAPHIIYSKHGDLFMDAVVVERDGKKPREIKLGTYKLAGLSGVEATKRLFAPLPGFDSSDPKYAGYALCVAQKKTV